MVQLTLPRRTHRRLSMPVNGLNSRPALSSPNVELEMELSLAVVVYAFDLAVEVAAF